MILRYNPRSERLRFDRTKFRALVHYVCWVCEDPRLLGPVKLGRLLWYAERNEYIDSGQQLSGATFVKRSYGPAPRALDAVLRELEKDRVIATRSRDRDSEGTQYFAMVKPDVSLLRAEQISSIERIIRGVCFEGSTSIPHQAAHDRISRVAAIGESLPCYTAFAGEPGAIWERDIAWAINQVRLVSLERRLEELRELQARSERVEEACLGLWWHLSRDPSVGTSLPGIRDSFFVYKQAGITVGIPDILTVYTLDLDELIMTGLHLEFDEVSDTDNAVFES